MADFKGGRGKKVGYKTQMYRIPTPLRPTVERLGMQFRLLWDGLADPTGIKLISRLEAAIPDTEQLSDSNRLNQISGKAEISISDIKYQELEDNLTLRDHNYDELWQENQRLLADQAKADAVISQLRSQLEDQTTNAEGSDAEYNPVRQWCVFHRRSYGKELFKGGFWTQYEAEGRIAKLKKDAHYSASVGDHPYLPPGTYEVRECLLAPVSKNSPQRENALLSQELDALHAKNGDLNLDISNLQEQIQQVRTQLEDQATKAGEWWEKAKLAQEELAEVREQLTYQIDKGGEWYSLVGKFEQENEQLRSQLEDQVLRAKEAETLAEERWLEIEQIRQHRDELRSMLDHPANKTEQPQLIATVDPAVIVILNEAIKLKPQAGGAIKIKIRDALALLN